MRPKLRFERVKAIGHLVVLSAFVIHFRHACSELFEFLFHRPDFVEYRHAFSEDSSSTEGEAILWQVAGTDSLGANDAALIKRLNSRKHLQQSGFARPIRSHNAHAVVGRDEPIEILKQELVAETLSGIDELNHGITSIVAESDFTTEARRHGDTETRRDRRDGETERRRDRRDGEIG